MSENRPQSPQNFESTIDPNHPLFDLLSVRLQNPNHSFRNDWQLPALTKQQPNEMSFRDHYGAGVGGSHMNFGLEVQRTGRSRQSTPLLRRQSHSQLSKRQVQMLLQQLQGLPLQRASLSSMNPQFSMLTQSSQPTTIQEGFRLQSVSSASTIQQQQQVFLPQQFSSSRIPFQNLHSLTQQQLAQLLQRQGLLGSQCQHQSSQCLNIQHMMQQFQRKQQESSQRKASSGYQNITSSGGSQPAPCVSASKNTYGGGNSIQGANAGTQLLGKRKIQDLVSQVDPYSTLDPAVEDLLLEIADDFIDSVTTFACNLAKHRKSSTLEPKDVLLHLEKNLQLNIPGYTKDGQTFRNELLSRNVHTEKLELIRSSVESQHFGSSGIQTFLTASSPQQPLKPSPSSEQLILSAGAPQMPQEAQRF